MKKKNLYDVQLTEAQTIYIHVVASSKAEARRHIKEYLKKNIIYPDCDSDWFTYDNDAIVGRIECVEEDTEEEGGI